MAWSKETEARDRAAQAEWAASWAGWETIPEHALLPGWNALHEQGSGGGRWPLRTDWTDVPTRFYGHTGPVDHYPDESGSSVSDEGPGWAAGWV